LNTNRLNHQTEVNVNNMKGPSSITSLEHMKLWFTYQHSQFIKSSVTAVLFFC